MTIHKIAFTMYPVRDMARARRFYEQDLGLTMTNDYHGAWVEYDLAGGCFAITTMVPHLSPSASAGGSIAFEVDDVDATVAALKAKGNAVKVEPFSSPVCRMAVVLDPEGNAVTLHRVTG
jgi:predicted enzyme related to lactoylglutathione lyase